MYATAICDMAQMQTGNMKSAAMPYYGTDYIIPKYSIAILWKAWLHMTNVSLNMK